MKNIGRLVSLISVFALLLAEESMARTVGMVVDSRESVTVFDAETDVALATVPVPTDFALFDCSMTGDQTRGFITDFEETVFVIDLTSTPPGLASAPNPIPISNSGQDTVITWDEKFLLVCGGTTSSNSFPLSVVDILSQTEINTFDLPLGCNSVDALSDNSVLVTTGNSLTIRRLKISATGEVTDTGDVLEGPGINVYGAPDARSGVVVTSGAPEFRSFTIPGLAAVDTRTVSGEGGGPGGFVLFGISGAINRAGDRFYVRSNGTGALDVFDYSSATGALGAAPLLTIPIENATNFNGVEQMALGPNERKLYVSQPGALNIYDSQTGELLNAIPVEGTARGVCFPRGVVLHDSLDIDDNGKADALTDGILVLRFLFQFTGDVLTANAVAPDCQRCTTEEIEGYLWGLGLVLDADGNGQADALTDGILILRYLFEFRGAALIQGGVVAPDCTRCSASAIESYLEELVP